MHLCVPRMLWYRMRSGLRRTALNVFYVILVPLLDVIDCPELFDFHLFDFRLFSPNWATSRFFMTRSTVSFMGSRAVLLFLAIGVNFGYAVTHLSLANFMIIKYMSF